MQHWGGHSGGGGDLRPTAICSAPSARVALLLDIVAPKLRIRVAHLVILVLRTLEDLVDVLAPFAVAAGPESRVAIGFGL